MSRIPVRPERPSLGFALHTSSLRLGLVGLGLLGAMSACNDDSSATDDIETDPVEVCEASDVACEDDLILTLGFQDFVSTGAVQTTALDGGIFQTTIDATAGGFGNSANNPWTYVRFDADGAVKVEIDDETSLSDTTWHLAAKRFIVRLNGGSSGPSCVAAAPFLERSFEELSSVPEGTRFVEDDYFTSDCTVVNDSSGLPNSPQVAMGAWWEYPGCVQTTDVPFLVQLDDGRVIRIVIDQYYAQGQDTCNTTDQPGTGGANLSLRWGFVQ